MSGPLREPPALVKASAKSLFLIFFSMHGSLWILTERCLLQCARKHKYLCTYTWIRSFTNPQLAFFLCSTILFRWKNASQWPSKLSIWPRNVFWPVVQKKHNPILEQVCLFHASSHSCLEMGYSCSLGLWSQFLRHLLVWFATLTHGHPSQLSLDLGCCSSIVMKKYNSKTKLS